MKRMHPVVCALFFLFIIIFTMITAHPVLIAVMLICSSLCVVRSKGIRFSLKYLKYIIPLAIITAIINPMFSHEGITILAQFPNGNMLTLESIVFGLGMALKLMTIFIWFIYLNEVMTSDRIMFLLGALTPYIANTFSMILRFIPRIHGHIKQVQSIRSIANKNLKTKKNRFIEGIHVLSSSITWILDDSVNTANSMRCRGYAARKRISYSIYRFTVKDLEWTIALVLIFAFLFFNNFNKVYYWQYYPYIKTGDINGMFILGAVLLLITGLLPVFDKA